MKPALTEILAALITLDDAGDIDAEIVCEGGQCWLVDRQIRAADVDALLRVGALSDASDVKGLKRYVVNSTGRAVVRRPALADDIRIALAAGGAWTIEADQLVRI